MEFAEIIEAAGFLQLKASRRRFAHLLERAAPSSLNDPKRTLSTFGQRSRVRMGRQAIVTVAFDAMMPFARLFLRIDMNYHE
jgi:hypothetical protein